MCDNRQQQQENSTTLANVPHFYPLRFGRPVCDLAKQMMMSRLLRESKLTVDMNRRFHPSAAIGSPTVQMYPSGSSTVTSHQPCRKSFVGCKSVVPMRLARSSA